MIILTSPPPPQPFLEVFFYFHFEILKKWYFHFEIKNLAPSLLICFLRACALRFIPHEPRKKTLIPYIYNASNQGPFLKFSEKNYKFKIPTVTGS